MTEPRTVLIAGGGVGGLCLAQGLRQAGIRVRVFERDRTAAVRGQGYRLRIDEHGIAALRRCLPDELFRLFEATANPLYRPRGAVFDQQLKPIMTDLTRAAAVAPRPPSTVANRHTLRQILLAGLGDVVEFGREVVGYDQSAGGVRIQLADSGVETGDLLVGADGINSAIRARLLPHAELVDTGLRGIYGHADLGTDLLARLPDELFGGSSPVLGPAGLTLAVGVYQPTEPPHRAVARIAPYARLSNVPAYAKWTLVGPPESLGSAEADLWTAAPATLYGIARRIVADWHPALAYLVARSDVATTFPLSIRAARPVDPWPSTRVTLLGDAIHATTPVGGTGANTALRDAAVLTECLGNAGPDPRAAVADYERQMRRYGFAAAARSLRGAEIIFRAPVSRV